MTKTQRNLYVQRRELLSDWLANRKAETLRARYLRSLKTPPATTADPRRDPRPR